MDTMLQLSWEALQEGKSVLSGVESIGDQLTRADVLLNIVDMQVFCCFPAHPCRPPDTGAVLPCLTYLHTVTPNTTWTTARTGSLTIQHVRLKADLACCLFLFSRSHHVPVVSLYLSRDSKCLCVYIIYWNLCAVATCLQMSSACVKEAQLTFC